MKNLIWDHVPKSVKTITGKWVQIAPNEGEGYRLYDPIAEEELGRILMDEQENWVYDGDGLTVVESEEIANAIKTHEPEMSKLLGTINRQV